MSEHLCTKEHAALTSSVLAMAHYVCEWADDATLFTLMATLASHAAQVAARIDQERYLCPPLTSAQHQMALGQAVPTPALMNEVNSIQMPASGRPG